MQLRLITIEFTWYHQVMGGLLNEKERSSQTKDHLFHLVILDVDSLRVISKKNQPDSNISGKIVLRNFTLSKEMAGKILQIENVNGQR